MNWTGVIPAITTPFQADGTLDLDFLAKHASHLVESGCTALVPLGSLGEGATLSTDEKIAVLDTCVAAVGMRAPVAAGISALGTREAVSLAEAAKRAGCQGLMVLPPYAYSTDWREMKAHVQAVIQATDLSCLLYNNPIAYSTDFLPEQIAELAGEAKNLHAVKESSGDVRRITSLRALVGDRLTLLVGVDDLIVEGVNAGARGWIAGVANALPKESVALFESALNKDSQATSTLYDWLLPLLRMDTVPKFVQLIKLMQAEVGLGSARVRAPRLQLSGGELAKAQAIIRGALANRPKARP
jgi:dihydrodipicolinate synthase/N-acetylneuraminate lyase